METILVRDKLSVVISTESFEINNRIQDRPRTLSVFDSSLNMAPSNITNVTMLYIKMCVFDYDLYRIILKVKVWLN